MKQLKNYNDLKLELEMAKERKNIISIYIKKLMYEEEQINNIIKEQNNTLNKSRNVVYKPSNKVCKNCGTINNANSKVCYVCGKRF